MAFTPDDQKSKPVMGYPSMSRYQQVPPLYTNAYHQGGYDHNMPYQGYIHHDHTKPYFSPAPNSYYSNQIYGPLATDNNGGTTKFGRIMLTMMIVLVIGMCFISLAVWLLFGSDVPEFHVTSISVSSFNITDSKVIANWDVNITVVNTNKNVEVEFDHVKTSIFYRNNLLAVASDPAIRLMPQQEGSIQSKLGSDEMVKTPLKDGVVSEIEKERSTGSVAFSVRLALDTKFSAKTTWRKESIRVYCESLRVSLSPAGQGNLKQSPPECLIFL